VIADVLGEPVERRRPRAEHPRRRRQQVRRRKGTFGLFAGVDADQVVQPVPHVAAVVDECVVDEVRVDEVLQHPLGVGDVDVEADPRPEPSGK